MSSNWIVRSVQPNNGIIRVHLSRDVAGQPEEILLNVVPQNFGEAFMEGDLRSAEFPLVSRAGRNGKDRV